MKRKYINYKDEGVQCFLRKYCQDKKYDFDLLDNTFYSLVDQGIKFKIPVYNNPFYGYKDRNIEEKWENITTPCVLMLCFTNEQLSIKETEYTKEFFNSGKYKIIKYEGQVVEELKKFCIQHQYDYSSLDILIKKELINRLEFYYPLPEKTNKYVGSNIPEFKWPCIVVDRINDSYVVTERFDFKDIFGNLEMNNN